MKKKLEKNFTVFMLFMIIALFISVVVTCCMGAVKIPVADTFKILTHNLFGISHSGMEELMASSANSIIWKIRFPRILLGIAVGAGLSLCGVAMQATVQNPLAEPYILGISSGSSLFATFSIFLGFSSFSLFGIPAVSIWSFIGALLASAAVILLASSGSKITSAKLILSGSIINALCSAFSNFIVTVAADAEGMLTLKFWTMGSLTRANWNNIWFPIIVVACLCVLYMILARPLNVLLVGDEAAITLGINLPFYRKLFLTTSALVTGVMVATCGIIGFVGLIVPHVMRAVIGADHRRLVPASAVSGALFMLWADALARTIIPNTELPIGILTSLVGAPVFAYIMIKKNYRFKG